MLNLPVSLTLGIEEEYQIVDPKTRNLAQGVGHFLAAAETVLPNQLKAEFMQCQVEVGSLVCADVAELAAELRRMRQGVFAIAHQHGLEVMAASSHPFAAWSDQNINQAARYQTILTALGTVASQLLICGLHIHLGFGHQPQQCNLMIDVMNQLRYFLPHILALSCSSPFWQGRDSGLKSYRSVIFEMLPRTGMPSAFKSYREYLEFVDLLGKVGAIGDGEPDGTKIWWDIRPHPKYGTLEIRIADICTNVEDAVAIAALLQALTAKLIVLRQENLSWRVYPRHHLIENKWRAMRYGMSNGLIDFGREQVLDFATSTAELLTFVAPVAQQLGTQATLDHLLTILKRGNSADRQLAVYHNALQHGADNHRALQAVVDFLIAESKVGVL